MPFEGYAYERGRKFSKGSSRTEAYSRTVTDTQTDGTPLTRGTEKALQGDPARRLANSLRLAGLGTGVRGRRQNFRNLWVQELCKVTSQLKLERQTGSGLMDGLLS